jgi:hypothetical protein
MGLPDDSNDPPPHTAAEDVQAVAVVPTEEALSVPLLDRNATENDLVEVISPAALPEGYTFDVIVNHKPFTITVVRTDIYGTYIILSRAFNVSPMEYGLSDTHTHTPLLFEPNK